MSYDELYNGEMIRPHYRDCLIGRSRMTPDQRIESWRRAMGRFSDDCQLPPLVRILPAKEYREIIAGVRQRGRAMQMFLADYYFGGREYERSGLITRTEVAQIESRYERIPAGGPRHENLQFWYAPDVIRNIDGKFAVLEDNIGFVGGIGDLSALAAAAQDLGSPALTSSNTDQFYQQMVGNYKSEATLAGGGKTILLSYPHHERPNHEDERLEHLMSTFGIEAVTNFRSLKVRDGGLFHLGERVGFVIMNVKWNDIEPVTATPYRISKFWETVNKGLLGVSFFPGIEFIGDKSFCPLVERLVEHYLNEACLLPSLSTLPLNHRSSFRTLRQAREFWVVKACKGKGGESVWIGRHMSETSWGKLLDRVAKSPGEFIAQSFCEPSQFLGRDVDLRPIAIVSPSDIEVSPFPWGRAAKSRRSKTNSSRGGLLTPIAVI